MLQIDKLYQIWFKKWSETKSIHIKGIKIIKYLSNYKKNHKEMFRIINKARHFRDKDKRSVYS